MNRRPGEWLKWVKMHAVDGVPMAKLAAKHRFDVSKLKYKVKVYQKSLCRRARKTRLYERGKTQGHLDRVRGEKSGRRVAWESAVPNADRVNDWVKLYKEKGESDSDPTPLAFLEVKAFPFGAVLLLYKAKRQKRLICGVFFIPFVLRRIFSIGIPSKSPRRF